MLVANDVTVEGAGFGSDSNRITIYSRDGLDLSLPLLSKREAADKLMRLAAERLAVRGRDGGSV
ncbi:bifunctional phosphopantothenoylcysteine decarboxylase/phosphopantothenate synthase [compost metagenome]